MTDQQEMRVMAGWYHSNNNLIEFEKGVRKATSFEVIDIKAAMIIIKYTTFGVMENWEIHLPACISFLFCFVFLFICCFCSFLYPLFFFLSYLRACSLHGTVRHKTIFRSFPFFNYHHLFYMKTWALPTCYAFVGGEGVAHWFIVFSHTK